MSMFKTGFIRSRRSAATKVAATLACALSMLSGSAMADQVRWRLTTFSPEGSADYRECVVRFVENVETLTNGEVKIQTFGAGVLAPAFETAEAVQSGLADAGIFFPAFMVNEDPANAFLAGLPGGMPTEATMAWLFSGGGQEIWQDFRRETMGLQPVPACIGSTEVFAHSHKPITRAEDLKGLKIRTAGAWASILKDYFGASPVTLSAADIFTALERKVIDATEYLTPTLNEAAGLHNITKYVITPGIHQPTYVYEFMIKQENWDKLSPATQRQIIAAGRLTMLEGYTQLSVNDIAAIGRMRASGGNEFLSPEPSLIAAVREASRDWIAKTSAKQSESGNPWMERFATSYLEFSDKWTSTADIRATISE